MIIYDINPPKRKAVRKIVIREKRTPVFIESPKSKFNLRKFTAVIIVFVLIFGQFYIPGFVRKANADSSWTGILAPSRAIDWSGAGLPATLPDGETTPNSWTPPTRTQQCGATMPSTSTYSDINTRIASCKTTYPNGSYILLDSGAFNITSSIRLTDGGASNVTLRGSGPMQTQINLSGSAKIMIGAASGNYGGLLTSDVSNFTQGVTSIKIGAVTGTSKLVVNNVAWFTQCDTGYSAQTAGQPINDSTNPCVGSHVDNGGLFICGLDPACDTNSVSPAANPHKQQQTVRITSVTDNGDGTYTVGFSPGLYMSNWAYAQSATMMWNDTTYTAVGNGLEDLTVQFQDNANQLVSLGPYAHASWVKGVRLIGKPANYSLSISGCSHCLVANNYIYPHSTTAGWGVGINNSGDSDTLILNNIVQGGPLYDGFGKSEGVVLAYNYARDILYNNYQAAVLEHQAGSSFNLKEGNQVGSMIDDDTWGTHTLNTWFRNNLFSVDPPYNLADTGVGILIGPFARFDNAIGNAIDDSGKVQNYETTANSTDAIFAFGSTVDPLNKPSSMRWGNYDTITGAVRWCGNSSNTGWSTTCNSTSEVPTSLSDNAAPFSNPVPANTTLPASFFMNNMTAYPNGGTGLSWWKVCTSWSAFPSSCATSQTSPLPIAGPDVTGGPYADGHAWDNPAALAYQHLPIDTSYQNSYTITGSSWSNGIETLTVSGLPSTNVIGGFQITGAPACNSSANSEFLMTGSTATTISYALASDPGSCTGGTAKYPNVRQFDEAVYMTDILSSTKAITSFDFNGLSPAVTGTINEGAKTVSLTVPYGTNVTALVPTIVHTGSSISPNTGVAQNFTNPVTYTVTAEDATTQDYTVTVTVAANTVKAITAFDFSGLTPVVTGTVTEASHTIALTVPYGTNVTALVSTITITGASVSPNNGIAQDFTNPVTYTVTAANASTQDYTVTVTVAPNTAKAITAFTISGQSGDTTINETNHTVALTVPYGTAVTALTPTITITGSSVNPASGVAQNFTIPVTYTVTAADISTQDYVVTITVASAPVSSGGGSSGSPAIWALPTVPTSGFKLTVNSGALTTSNRNVLLGFNVGTDIKKIAISMTGDFTDASQEDYTPTKQWDLCSKFGGLIKNPTCQNGTYKVYAQFYTAYGRTSATAIASSTITLKSGSVNPPTDINVGIGDNQSANQNQPFTKPLKYGMYDADVKRLQIFLNQDPETRLDNKWVGSPGKETNFFGPKTWAAVRRFQEKYGKDILSPWGLVRGTGYVGKTTLAKINELISKIIGQ